MTVDRAAVAEVLGDSKRWAVKCHEASLLLARSGVLGPSRVARGWALGVVGQHSWVVLGDDCYAKDATIVDPTLWSQSQAWRDRLGTDVWVGTLADGIHEPHGAGSIWAWGRPENCAPQDAIPLDPARPWSGAAESFLELLGPLDRRGWMMLASNAPVEGWPAGEILDAICETDGLSQIVPIDRVGMLTNRNPGGLYLATNEEEE